MIIVSKGKQLVIFESLGYNSINETLCVNGKGNSKIDITEAERNWLRYEILDKQTIIDLDYAPVNCGL